MNSQNLKNNRLNMQIKSSMTRGTLKQRSAQNGMTGIGMALILALVAFFALIALRLFPVYMEHFSVTSHLKQLASDSGVKQKTDAEILDTLYKRFSIDGVKSVKGENIFIEREKNGSFTVAIEYEVRTPAIGNVEMVVIFADEVEIN